MKEGTAASGWIVLDYGTIINTVLNNTCIVIYVYMLVRYSILIIYFIMLINTIRIDDSTYYESTNEELL